MPSVESPTGCVIPEARLDIHGQVFLVAVTED